MAGGHPGEELEVVLQDHGVHGLGGHVHHPRLGVAQPDEEEEQPLLVETRPREFAQFGLVETKDATVENYVTRKALDGLFFVIAEEERAIRRDPLGQSSKILRSVFGAMGR